MTHGTTTFGLISPVWKKELCVRRRKKVDQMTKSKQVSEGCARFTNEQLRKFPQATSKGTGGDMSSSG